MRNPSFVVDKPTKAKLYELYILDGNSTRAIARMFEVCYQTINRWLKEYDIPIRQKSDALRNACNRGLCDGFLKSGRQSEEVSLFMRGLWANPEFKKTGVNRNRKVSHVKSKKATLSLSCAFCNKVFKRLKCYVDRSCRRGAVKIYCSQKCANNDRGVNVHPCNTALTAQELSTLSRLLGDS